MHNYDGKTGFYCSMRKDTYCFLMKGKITPLNLLTKADDQHGRHEPSERKNDL